MAGNEAQTGSLNSRFLLYAPITAVVVFLAVEILPTGWQFFEFFIIAPTLVVLTVIALLYFAFSKRRRETRPTLVALAIVWPLAVSLFFFDAKFPILINSEVRWLVSASHYKREVLAQPASDNGDFKHIEWDGWGWVFADTSAFLVFDPGDTLAGAKINDPGQFEGLPCAVRSVRRLEKEWYVVIFYTNQYWPAKSGENCKAP